MALLRRNSCISVICHFSVGLAAESDDDANLSPLEKFQVVLQKQSDALISLGFDPTVKVMYVYKYNSHQISSSAQLLRCAYCMVVPDVWVIVCVASYPGHVGGGKRL